MSNWVNTVNKNYIKKKQKRLAAFLIISCYLKKIKKRSYTKKHFWVLPLFWIRSDNEYGFYNAVLPTISREISTFKNYFCINFNSI